MKQGLKIISSVVLLVYFILSIFPAQNVSADSTSITLAKISPVGPRTNNTRPIVSGMLSSLSPSVMVYFDDLGTTLGPYDYFVETYLSSTDFTTENENFSAAGSGAYETDTLPYGTYRVFAENITNFDQPPSYYEIAASYVIENIKPTLRAAETVDLDKDNKTDAIRITFSEAILDSSVRASDFSISGFSTVLFDPTLDDANDNTVYFKLNEAIDSKPTPRVTYTKGTLSDLAGNLTDNDHTGIMATDKVGPAVALTSENISPVDSDTIVITGTAESGSLIATSGGKSETQLQLLPNQNTFTLLVNLKQNAVNNLTINATDGAGNQSRTIEISIQEDSSPPSLTVTAPENNATVNGPFTISFETADPAGVATQILVNEIVQAGFISGQELNLASGTYQIKVAACDALGHCTQDLRRITVDITAGSNQIKYATTTGETLSANASRNRTVFTAAAASLPQAVETVLPIDNSTLGNTEAVTEISDEPNGAVKGAEEKTDLPSSLRTAIGISLILFIFTWSKFLIKYYNKKHSHH